ncbi:MAG: hypothetical protein LBD93_08760 [Treponema sp.]|jgi:hypothetical protein|nr:hypothetical protein [Treponema sp.]
MMHEGGSQFLGGGDNRAESERYWLRTQDIFKERGIYIGWIVGILLLGGGLWFFTQSLRTTLLRQTVNQVLEKVQDSRRLDGLIPQPPSWGRIPWGNWYTLTGSKDRVLVFSLMSNGTFIPCMAVVSSATGKVVDDTILPLTSHPEQTLKQIPRGLIKIYIQRIESPSFLPTGAVRQ